MNETTPVSADEIRVLLVEDNDGDALLTQEAFRSSSANVQLIRKRDGVDAKSFLEALDPTDYPSLVLLDLNMPRMGGLELLEWLRSCDSTRRLPVLVVSTSNSDADIARAYELTANCYIRKPLEFAAFESLVEQIVSFWFGAVTLSRGSGSRARA